MASFTSKSQGKKSDSSTSYNPHPPPLTHLLRIYLHRFPAYLPFLGRLWITFTAASKRVSCTELSPPLSVSAMAGLLVQTSQIAAAPPPPPPPLSLSAEGPAAEALRDHPAKSKGTRRPRGKRRRAVRLSQASHVLCPAPPSDLHLVFSRQYLRLPAFRPPSPRPMLLGVYTADGRRKATERKLLPPL